MSIKKTQGTYQKSELINIAKLQDIRYTLKKSVVFLYSGNEHEEFEMYNKIQFIIPEKIKQV